MNTIDLNNFCTQLRKGELDEQISALEETAQEQLKYNHPLKPSTNAEQHFWGKYNLKAVELLKQLKAHIESGERAVDEFEA